MAARGCLCLQISHVLSQHAQYVIVAIPHGEVGYYTPFGAHCVGCTNYVYGPSAAWDEVSGP
jgi:hypothetical protein